MRFDLPCLILLAACSVARAEPATQPAHRVRTGPLAASLATPYSGPVRYGSLKLMQDERAAATIRDPATRAATWRYYYESPRYYWGWGCGYGYGWCWSGCRYGLGAWPTTVTWHGEY